MHTYTVFKFVGHMPNYLYPLPPPHVNRKYSLPISISDFELFGFQEGDTSGVVRVSGHDGAVSRVRDETEHFVEVCVGRDD